MIPTETTEPTPIVPDPAAAPASAAASTGAVAEPTPQPNTQPAAPVNPFDPAYLQSRVDAYLKSQKPAATPAATAPDAAAATETPAAPVADPAPAAETPEGEPAANAEPTANAPAAETPAAPDPELVVELPPRNVGGEPLKIVAPDKATADRLRMTAKNGLRADEYKARLEAVEARELAVRETEVLATTDPLGLIERAPADTQLFAARQLLAANFDALRPDIEAWWQNDTERRLALSTGQNERTTARGNFESAKSVQQQVQAIARTVVGLIPDDATGTPDAEDFYADSLAYLARLSDQRKFTTQEIPQLLASRLRRYGFAAADATPAPAAAVSAASASAPAAPAPAASAAPTASQQPASVQRLHQVNQQRAAARASVPVGAGASPATLPKPPKGLTIEQTADWMLQHQRARSA